MKPNTDPLVNRPGFWRVVAPLSIGIALLLIWQIV